MPSHLGLRPVNDRTVAKLLRWFNIFGVFFWTAMMAPALLWWTHSITFVNFVSVYALIQGSFTALMANRTEKRQIENGGDD